MADKKEFTDIYDKLSIEGKCDSVGGAEYDRVWSEWETYEGDMKLEEFIVWRANVGSSELDWPNTKKRKCSPEPEQLHVVPAEELKSSYTGENGDMLCRSCGDVLNEETRDFEAEKVCPQCNKVYLCEHCARVPKKCYDCAYGTLSRNDMLRTLHAIAKAEGTTVDQLALKHGIITELPKADPKAIERIDKFFAKLRRSPGYEEAGKRRRI